MSAIPTVALINPPVYDFSAYDLWAKPFGLLVIADHLRRSGIGARLIDAMDPFSPYLAGLPSPPRKKFGHGKFHEADVPKPSALKDVPRNYHRYGLPAERIEAAMRDAGDVSAVLITCAMTYWYTGAFEAINIAKTVWPNAPVILGGIYATLCSNHARGKSGADAILPGPWEQSIGDFIRLTGIDIPSPEGPLFSPALDLYPRLEYAPLMLSRGCPFRCAYCASGMLHDKYSRRAPGDVIEEMEKLVARGIHDFAFYDDALLWRPEEGIMPLLETIIERGIAARLHAPNGLHIAKIGAELAKLLRRAGFATLRLGVESLSKEMHAKWGGKAEPEDLASVAKALFDAGYERGEVGAYLLAGLPGQRAAEVEKDIRAINAMGIRPYLAEYSPLPGTALFESAKAASRYDIVNEPLNHNNSALPCAGPDFTMADLQRLKQLTWPAKNKDV